MSRPATVQHPATEAGTRAFVVTPFNRLARAHAACTMADAMFAASLAGSFLSLPAGNARGPVFKYLLMTMLPFAVLSPLIGPLIDRMKGGHRLMVIGSAIARAVVCWFMISEIRGGHPLFYVYALLILVAQKAYSVARSALVPSVVDGEEALVEANSKLSLISGIAGFVGVVPAGILLKLLDARFSIGLAMLTYAVAAVISARIPKATVAEKSADLTERQELRGATIIMAGSAMGFVRMCVGFLFLLVAFDFRGGGRPVWQFGFVAGVSVVSQLVGAAVAPRIRAFTSEENLLMGAVGIIVVGAVASFLLGDVAAVALVGGCVGFAAGSGKLAFDSILQRDAPDANRGRAFAKFETRFQVLWVVGALLPVLPGVHISARTGLTLVFLVALFALASYTLARGSYAHRSGSRQTPATARAVEIESRIAGVSEEVKGRVRSAPRSVYRRIRTQPDGQYDDDQYDDEDQYDGDGDGDGHGDGGDRPRGGDSDLDFTDPSAELPRPSDAGFFGSGNRPGGAQPADRSRATDDRRWVADPDPELAGSSRVAWRPPPADTDDAFPWEAPAEPDPAPDAFLADVDPSVGNPFPWTPTDERPVIAPEPPPEHTRIIDPAERLTEPVEGEPVEVDPAEGPTEPVEHQPGEHATSASEPTDLFDQDDTVVVDHHQSVDDPLAPSPRRSSEPRP